ncbi:MAG TPA: DUF4383 domain-containing protein [Micromonosporaceae bacterium]
MHIPVNHPLRPLYRTLAGLVGLYVLVFGVLGVLETWGDPLFSRESTWVLGLRTNLAFSLMSVVFGAIIIVGSFTGGNIGHYLSLTIGVIFLGAGLGMMALMYTDLNLLNFSMSTVIVSLLFGLLFLTTGLYDKVSKPGDLDVRDEREPEPSRKR